MFGHRIGLETVVKYVLQCHRNIVCPKRQD
ncbi:MAG: hypothetical protein ACR2MG_16140 [Pyrinomonadaceae bacterium]